MRRVLGESTGGHLLSLHAQGALLQLSERSCAAHVPVLMAVIMTEACCAMRFIFSLDASLHNACMKPSSEAKQHVLSRTRAVFVPRL